MSARIKTWGARPLARVVSDDRPVILRYHRVFPDGRQPFYDLGIPASTFALHIEWLSKHRSFVSLDQIVAWVERRACLPSKAVALTFDDGYRDNLTEALPVLTQYEAPATIFLVSHLMEQRVSPWWDRLADTFEKTKVVKARLSLANTTWDLQLETLPERRSAFELMCEQLKLLPDRQRKRAVETIGEALAVEIPGPGDCPLLSWEDARLMQDAGIEFGSHTCGHPILTRLGEEEARREIRDSKELIESRLGREVKHFSYPNGKRADFSAKLEQQVRAAGYASAVTTLEGPLRSGESQFALSRKGITEATLFGSSGRFSEELLQVELSGFYDTLFLRRWRDRRIH